MDQKPMSMEELTKKVGQQEFFQWLVAVGIFLLGISMLGNAILN